MALSNRDRVGRGLELLARGLKPFVDQRMAAAAPPGADWLELVAAKDRERHGGGARTYSRDDVALLLRMLTEEWRVFKEDLTRNQSGWASELRDTRNQWAHQGNGFSDIDTGRALENVWRLLQAVGAVEEAAAAQRLHDDHQAAAWERRSRKAAQDRQAGTVDVGGANLSPWREVIEPHEDITTDNFIAAEFAANLHRVTHKEEKSPEYTRPVEFFRRTYLTEGLRDLLTRAARRLAGDPNAPPVVNLQTAFGGGKTHSILALYHLFSGTPLSDFPQDLQDLLGDVGLAGGVRRATFVGNHVQPSLVHEKPDGTRVRTVWGELAYQLGGTDGYALVARADETGTNPGDAMHEVIAAAAPCLILIDEWVAYARQLHRDDLPAGTFDTQFTFAQTLTEAVAAVPGALLAVSIPASERDDEKTNDMEVGGARGREALDKLRHVVGRVAEHWRPASPRESFEIVRRRLFKEYDADARRRIAAVAKAYQEMYVEHAGEFPRGTGDFDYADRIRECYPIHPELFDRLYQDWSALERFQRTRGVLRLMSTVIAALWQSPDSAPMIMPGTVPLDDDRVVDELTSYLEDQWKTIIDTDVDGPGSTPVRIDKSRTLFGKRHMTRRLARTIFLGSAARNKGANKVIDRQWVWLGAAIPGDTVGNFGSALQQLTDTATYLYSDSSRYWYDTQQSVARSARDYAASLLERPGEVWHEIVTRLKEAQTRKRGRFAAVHVAPDSPGEIQDTDQVRLVILHPRHEHKARATDSTALEFARAALRTHGGGTRDFRNMLVFLTADSQRLQDLMDATRDYLAWDHVCGQTGELNLTQAQTRQAQQRRQDTNKAVDLRIDAAYTWVLAPPSESDPSRPQVWNQIKADSAADSLAERVSKRLVDLGELYVQQAAPNIRQYLNNPLQGVWEDGHVSVGKLWELYTRYTYLPRLRDRDVLNEGIRSALDQFNWQQDGFALATGYDEAAGRYTGLAFYNHNQDAFGQVTDSTLLVKPSRAIQQKDEIVGGGGDEDKDEDQGTGNGGRIFPPGPTGTGDAEKQPPAPQKKTRFVGVYEVTSDLYGKKLADLQNEILPHLVGEGGQLKITVEIQATQPGGFDEQKISTVSENARTLKFVQAQFDFDDL